MISIDKEVEAAKAAKAVINVLSGITPKSAVATTIRAAINAAVLNLGTGGALNEARTDVGIALSTLMHGPPTTE
jgi:hypothetical protein